MVRTSVVILRPPSPHQGSIRVKKIKMEDLFGVSPLDLHLTLRENDLMRMFNRLDLCSCVVCGARMPQWTGVLIPFWKSREQKISWLAVGVIEQSGVSALVNCSPEQQEINIDKSKDTKERVRIGGFFLMLFKVA